MTCCVEKYPVRPTLKRNYSRYHLTKGAYLELIYESNKYIVISIYKKRSFCDDLGTLCRNVRHFINDKLQEVKRNSFCGLQFTWCIQHPGAAVPVDPSKLICIDGYETNNDIPLTKLEGRIPVDVELESHELTALNYWFAEQAEFEIFNQQVPFQDTPVVKAVLRHGCDKWYQLASKMGFSHSEITAISSDKPNYSDKLLAIINVMRQNVGQEEEAERILLKACQGVHPPIYGVVCDEVQINVRSVDDH